MKQPYFVLNFISQTVFLEKPSVPETTGIINKAYINKRNLSHAVTTF